MASKKKDSPLDYETAMAELEGIIQRLEEKDVPLDELTRHLDRTTLLIQYCKAALTEADTAVNKALRKLEA